MGGREHLADASQNVQVDATALAAAAQQQLRGQLHAAAPMTVGMAVSALARLGLLEEDFAEAVRAHVRTVRGVAALGAEDIDNLAPVLQPLASEVAGLP